MSERGTMDARGLRAHYAALLQRYGPSYRAVDWGSEEGQHSRFRVLCEVADLRGASVLDVGCGVGHLYDHFRDTGLAVDYRGVDIVPEMIDAARHRHPTARFEVADAGDAAWPDTTDYVLASGIFAFSSPAAFKAIVPVLFKRARRALAFNCLSAWRTAKEPGEFYPDPGATLTWCRNLTARATLRHDYHDGDFTVFLFRTGP